MSSWTMVKRNSNQTSAIVFINRNVKIFVAIYCFDNDIHTFSFIENARNPPISYGHEVPQSTSRYRSFAKVCNWPEPALVLRHIAGLQFSSLPDPDQSFALKNQRQLCGAQFVKAITRLRHIGVRRLSELPYPNRLSETVGTCPLSGRPSFCS